MPNKLKLKEKKEEIGFKRHFIKQLLALSTSGFGLVAALAWNNLIQEVVTTYIKPFTGSSSGVISLLIYALVVTILAVVVMYYLAKLEERT